MPHSSSLEKKKEEAAKLQEETDSFGLKNYSFCPSIIGNLC
jgi:hypothetical protein